MSYPFHRSKHHNELQLVNSNVQDDGRVRISFHNRAHEFFHSRDKRDIKDLQLRDLDEEEPKPQLPSDFRGVPRLCIAILITGSRGDVQPFIALGQTLRDAPYNHRVRIGTHSVFKDFVEENGLEFFSIGGDPASLMSYMVRNPGIMPSIASIKAGDISKRKAELAEMLEGAWNACTAPGDGIHKINLEDHQGQDQDLLLSLPPPFVADAIIANPPTYAHVHIAEKLGVPLHLMFTMPWTPTGDFPHPLAQMDATKVDARVANFLSYKRMELLTFTGISDIINHFRERTLHLDAISPAWGHVLFQRLKVPFTYCWSEALIPKPADWGPHINISGFFFLSLASSYQPDDDLQAFLDAGPPPVYIGFGSIVVDDPNALTRLVFDAVKKAGVRALVSKGWGNVGGSSPPENVYLLGNVPHDWLFPRCSAVVHHGGAGTTAIGVALGLPTVIVPFFGDQAFWGGMIYRAGAGPEPVPYKKLTAEKLAEMITGALQPDIKAKAHELSMEIKGENGTKKAAEQFHAMPQMQNVACFLCPDRIAVWRIRRTNIQLSALATAVLVVHGRVKGEHLKLVRHKRWYVEEGAQDPLLGALSTFTTGAVGIVNDLSDYKRELFPHDKLGNTERHSLETKKSTETDRVASKSRPSNDTSLDSSHSSQSSSKQAESQDGNAHKLTQSSTSGTPTKPKSKHNRFVSATGHFAESVAAHTLKAPVALAYNVTNGFHNAPAAFLGDKTVRVRDNITGLGTGLVVGGKELGFGLYDAFTGVVTHPYHGYHEGSTVSGHVLGTAKGVGRGLGGLVSKSCAAVLGVPAYGLKGLQREIERWYSGSDALLRSEQNVINNARQEVFRYKQGAEDERPVAAGNLMWEEAKGTGVGKRIVERRIWQGYRELKEFQLGDEDHEQIEREILSRWDTLKVDECFLAGL
ncbi:hypothetical protein MBLNU459_g6487t2 [Dothideomycetes sp. NU459]